MLSLHSGKGDIPIEAFVQQKPNAAPVFGNKCDPFRKNFCCFRNIERLTLKDNLAAGMEQPHNAIRDTNFSLPCQTANTEYLSLLNGESRVVD